jgi:hypothetical protein
MLFVADRVDGLGGRLGSMIEASWLADRLGGRFVFYWRAEGVSDQMNAIVAKEEVFSAAFLERHHRARAELARLAIRPLGAVHRDLAGVLRPGSGIDGLSVNWQPPLARLLHGMPGLEGIDGDRRAIYEAIGLAPGPARARALAQRVALAPGTAALHLRAGDIVYGRYRASDLFHAKVSPYTAVLGILRAKAAQGAPVVVFGQDEELCRAARDEYGAVLAADLTRGLGLLANEQAVFEIALMSRCAEIFAGTSAFTACAARIGGVTPRDPRAMLPPAQMAAGIARALDDPATGATVSRHQKAMAAWHAFIAVDREAERAEGEPFLAKAIACDPENPFYRAVAALRRYRQGDPEAGERLLLDAFLGEAMDPGLVDFMLRHLARSALLSKPAMLAALAEAARTGRPVASLFLAFRARLTGDADGLAAWTALYARDRAPGMPEDPETLYLRLTRAKGRGGLSGSARR